MRILMVCLGNICRSPLAEGVMRHKIKEAGLDWEVDSAGTYNFHVGEPPYHSSQWVAKKNGLDISDLRARHFEAEDFHTFDLIYAMANDVMLGMQQIGGADFKKEKAVLFLDELHPGKSLNLKDPYYGTEKDFEDVYELINSTCDAIIQKYSGLSKTI